MAEKIVEIKQIKGIVRCLPKQRATLEALGLRGIRKVVRKNLTPQIQGMIQVVHHMVEVEEV